MESRTLEDETGRGVAQGDGLVQLLGLARRRAALVAFCSAACLVLAAGYAMIQTPVYRATAELLVAPQALQVVGRDIVRPDSSASLDFASVDSQALVIVSTAVLRQVSDALDLTADPAYLPHPGLLSRVFGPPPAPSADQREAEVLDQLKQSVVVHRVDNALVFQITASNPRASRAAEIANALAAAYLRVTAQDRVESVKRADSSIISQVSGIREQLDAADAAVERYRSANGLVRSSDTGLVVTQQLKDLYTQIDAAGAEVSRLAARKEQVAKIGPDALLADSVPDALNSPTLITLRAQYASLAREAASQGRTLLPQHPHMLELRAELAETQKQLRAELSRMRVSVSDSYAQAVVNLSKLQAKAKDLTRDKNDSSEAETKLRQLESEAQAIRAVFDASLGRARELEQQGKIETSNSRLLSEATPPLRPSKPPLMIVCAAAALFGACLGLGLAYLLERFPRRTGANSMSPRDAGRLLGVGTTIVLPRSDSMLSSQAETDALVLALGPVVAELRGALQFRLPALVAVVAARGASGLQATAEPLGQALADLGEEVLLCEGGDPSSGLAVRRVSGRTGTASRPPRAALGRPAPGATVERGEFIVTAVDLERPRPSALDAARSADAIVLVVNLARTGPDVLLEAARAVDPSRRRIVALVVSQAPERRHAGRTGRPVLRATA